jgi:hypothetical protein
MQRKPERFYAYWSWQVFVRDKNGNDKRLTGPDVSASGHDAAVHS